jgi:hypothetical protein
MRLHPFVERLQVVDGAGGRSVRRVFPDYRRAR